MLSLYYHIIVGVSSLYYHCVVIVLSLCYHCIIIVLSNGQNSLIFVHFQAYFSLFVKILHGHPQKLMLCIPLATDWDRVSMVVGEGVLIHIFAMYL